MTRHDTPVEPLPGLVPVATNFNLWPPSELKPISLTLFFLARYSAIFSGIIELSRCHTNVPVNNELDLKVKSLILQALAEPEYSQRLRKIQSLLDLIDYLPKSKTKERIDMGLQTYYDDALQMTVKYMTKNLEKFSERYDIDVDNATDSDVCQCFVRWYNLNIKTDCIDVRRQHKKIRFFSLDAPTSEENAKTKEEIIPDPRPKPPIDYVEQQERFLQLKAYLEQDPEQRLRNCCSKKYPICNCWELIKRRILTSPQTFKQIKKDLDIPLDNITRLWYNKCVPLLAEIAREIGYEIDVKKFKQKEEEE
ncbi:hypothetical protein [Microcoleus sp.]|uniref:hypothetical protein n=1 Tax=Microcoleus sp. TaxID=44472 RepID=UPI0035251C35